jgi:hypothetical protein
LLGKYEGIVVGLVGKFVGLAVVGCSVGKEVGICVVGEIVGKVGP